MKQCKRDKLAELGYRVTGAQEFLGLSAEEMALIHLKISLIEKLEEVRGGPDLPGAVRAGRKP